jgi:hypothetical protein
VCLAQTIGNANVFLSVFKQSLHDTFIQTWEGRLNESSRALFYNSIRYFTFQPYLQLCKFSKFRQSLTRLRVSSHRLEVEAGRWNKPTSTPYNERKCKHCNLLENEYHFVLVCPLYVDLRKQYLKRYFTQRPSMFIFISLINSESGTEVRNLAMFVQKAFQIRNDYIFNQH